jgi:hypothetical protein
MLSFHDAAAIAAAPTTMSIDPTLRQLIADRVHDWNATDLLDLTHLAIVQAGDTEEAVIDEVAFSPLSNPLDGKRFGSKDFEPCWDWLERHDGWFEMIMTVGNDGFAFVLFIEDSAGIDHQLRQLCQTYAPATHQ